MAIGKLLHTTTAQLAPGNTDKDKAIYVRAYADNFFRTVGAQIRNDSFHAKAFLAKCQALYDDADILDPSGAIK